MFSVFLQKIVDILQEEARDVQFHRNADCFILIILTHGTQNAIYGSDGKTVDIKEIKDMFNARNFFCMENKPKLFFFQACRGGTLYNIKLWGSRSCGHDRMVVGFTTTYAISLRSNQRAQKPRTSKAGFGQVKIMKEFVWINRHFF